MADHAKNFTRFTTGIDRRQPEDVTSRRKGASMQFQDLLNCHVTANMQIEKRAGVVDLGSFGVDVVGLFAFDQKLWTFENRSMLASTHTLVWTIGGLKFPDGAFNIVESHYAGVFLGGVYVALAFDNAAIRHYYLNPGLRTWAQLKADDTALAVDPAGIRVLPTAALDEFARVADLGFFYEAEQLGKALTGDTEPIWPRVYGARVNDGEIQWTTFQVRTYALKKTFLYVDEGRIYIHPVDNGFVYRSINLVKQGDAKTSGDVDPIWPIVPGETVVDGELVWEAIAALEWSKNAEFEIDYPIELVGPDEDEYDHEAVRAFVFPSSGYGSGGFEQFKFAYIGTWARVHLGATEPAWPREIGQTIDDGAITWKCVGTEVDDERCPQTAQVLVHQEKIYAIGSSVGAKTEADIVRFSATGDPFDWSSDDDAGFLPTGLQAAGSEIAKALGRYNDQLVVLMPDSIEIWAVSPDPAEAALVQVIGALGTNYDRTVIAFSTDLVFLSSIGIRSVSQQRFTDNLEDSDVGSPIDELVLAQLARLPHRSAPPLATYYQGKGQYWVCIADTVFVYARSQLDDVAAWSRYLLPNEPRYFAEVALPGESGMLYYLDDLGHLCRVEATAGVDYDGAFPVEIHGAFQPLDSVGLDKQIAAVDVVLDGGAAALSHKYDPRDLTKETAPVRVQDNTRLGPDIPVECTVPEIAPVLRYTGADGFRFDALTYYWNV